MPRPVFKIERPADTAYMNALIYGATGAGKTRLAGSAQDCVHTSPALLVDIEGGSLTLAGSSIDVTRPRNYNDVQEIYDFFLHENKPGTKGHYRCIIIDSLTELQRKVSMGGILGELEDGEYRDLRSISSPQLQDWQKINGQTRRSIYGFRDLAYLRDVNRRVHVIMIALERVDERRALVEPGLSGALSGDAGAMVDMLGRLSVVSQDVEDADGNVRTVRKRYLLTAEREDDEGVRYLAKNRGDRLGNGIWDPTVDKLISLWRQDAPAAKEAKDVE